MKIISNILQPCSKGIIFNCFVYFFVSLARTSACIFHLPKNIIMIILNNGILYTTEETTYMDMLLVCLEILDEHEKYTYSLKV